MTNSTNRPVWIEARPIAIWRGEIFAAMGIIGLLAIGIVEFAQRRSRDWLYISIVVAGFTLFKLYASTTLKVAVVGTVVGFLLAHNGGPDIINQVYAGFVNGIAAPWWVYDDLDIAPVLLARWRYARSLIL
jgi:hypothetical protein